MYFSLYFLFPFFHIVLWTLLFLVIMTPSEYLCEEKYANTFVLDRIASLDKLLIFCTPANTFTSQIFFKLKYV